MTDEKRLIDILNTYSFDVMAADPLVDFYGQIREAEERAIKAIKDLFGEKAE